MTTATQTHRAAATASDELDVERLKSIAGMVRYYILAASTKAGSGHPSSSMSAVELMVALFFGGAFRYDLENPGNPNNDRLIFSKGHASPLFYGLWLAAGRLTAEEMMTYREFGSPLEGHPMPVFPYTEAATGSLGQGLSVGVGMALNARLVDKLPYRTYVLLGDSEMAEGSQWEAMEIAAHYQLDNLVGVLDVNRLGQRGETMYGHDLHAYERRASAFGWETVLVDGHNIPEIHAAYRRAGSASGKPTLIIARTLKGKGVSQLEDKPGWHGKPIEKDKLDSAIAELGPVDLEVRGAVSPPEAVVPKRAAPADAPDPSWDPAAPVATRAAYGKALTRIYPRFPDIVCLDGEVSNSTGAETFKKAHPDRFFEMYIAEQNLVGAALGLSRRGKIPFVSTFAAFLSRAFDQIRMAQYSNGNIKFVGSHAGVSIGEDGPSQMGLEDIAMFRSVLGSVVLHPCDAVSTDALVEEAAQHHGILYLRTLRQKTPILYRAGERFPIGGSKVLRQSAADVATVVGCGATTHEALAAHDLLKEEGIAVRVIDAYSIKPIDAETLRKAASETRFLVTVEDHYAEGGLGEAVMSALQPEVCVPVHRMAVEKRPRSGKPEQLQKYAGIYRDDIASVRPSGSMTSGCR
jgi:transketolase